MAFPDGRDIQHFSDQTLRQLARQVAHLQRDAGRFGQQAERYGAHLGHDAGNFLSDLADQAWHQGEAATRYLGKRVKKAGKAVSRDPAPAVAAVVGLACLMTLLLSSGKRR